MSVFACSDLHGDYKLWNMIQQDLKPEDILYFLGDAADRGPEGWKIIKELLADERVIYIQGNHEDMLYRRFHGFGREYVVLHDNNGGRPTAEAALQDKDYETIICQLHQLPYYAIYTNTKGSKIFLSHSGFCEDLNDIKGLLWDRHHYFLEQHEYDLVIHGHTPIDCLIEDLSFIGDTVESSWDGAAYFYAAGTKCDIDMGTCWTHKAIVLDLDTLISTLYVRGDEYYGED